MALKEFNVKNAYCKRVWDELKVRYADQEHFLQAAGLVLETLSNDVVIGLMSITLQR